MYLSHLFQRDGSQCTPGDTYYVCVSNGFTGCCSASNVCELSGCPDGNSNAPTTTITLSTEGSAPKATAASSAKTSSPATTTPAAMLGNVAMAGSGTASAVNQSPSASQSSISNRDTKTNNTPIIAGVVCSIVAVSILSILAWFILRRRQQKSQQRIISSSKFGTFAKEYDLNRRSTDEEQAEQQTRGGETYGSYKGYQPAPITGTAAKFSNTSMAIEESSQEDEPLPDPEKTGLESPPDSEHPAYHPLPGQSPEIPTYSTYSATPATPTTPITPIHSQQQKQHPAYHAFQLSQHPAFRSPRQPASAVRSKPSNLQQEVTPPLEGFSFVSRVRNSIYNLRPSSRSNPNMRSELPADVPRTLLLSAKSDPSLLFRFNTNSNSDLRNSQQSSTSHFQKGHRNAKRGKASRTGVSTHSIPIGLGVDSPSTPGLNSPVLDTPITPGPLSPAPVTGTAYKLPMQKFISNANRKPVGGPKLVSSKPPTPEMPAMPTMPPAPMKANMNEREDHVMSWASYSAGNLSGIGPSSSSSSAKSRKQRQREIELGVASKPKKDYSQRRPKPAELQGDVPVGENGTPPMNIEHEIMRWSELRGPQRVGSQAFSEVPETPLSQIYRESWVERESWALR